MMPASLQWLMLVSFMWSSGDSILRTCMISFAVDQRFPDSLIRNDRCQRKTGTPFCWYRLPWLRHFHHIFDVRQPKPSLWAWQRSFRKDHLDKVGTQGRRKKSFVLKTTNNKAPNDPPVFPFYGISLSDAGLQITASLLVFLRSHWLLFLQLIGIFFTA